MLKVIRPLALVTMVVCAVPAFAQDASISQAAGEGTFVAQAQVPSTAPSHPITDDQRHRLSTLRDQFELDNALKKAQLNVSQRQLREVLHATTIDKSAALALQSKINGLTSDLSTAKLNLTLASGDVFTAEQKADWKERRNHWGGRRGGCDGGGHGFGRGGHHGGPGHFKAMPSANIRSAENPQASEAIGKTALADET